MRLIDAGSSISTSIVDAVEQVVTERRPEVGRDLVGVLARHRADVDVEVDDVGDHVRLRTTLRARRTFGRERRVRAGVEVALARRAAGGRRAASSIASSSSIAAFMSSSSPSDVDLTAPQLVEARRRLVVGQP